MPLSEPPSQARRSFRYLTIPKHDREAPYLVRERVKCGKLWCRCARGAKHGPYWYLRYQEWDPASDVMRYRREYVPRTEVGRVRRWIRHYRAENAFGRGLLGLLRRCVAGVETRKRRKLAARQNPKPRAPVIHRSGS